MKKLVLIFFILPFLVFSQDYEQYMPKVAWSTDIDNVVFINTDTFTVEVLPLDLNEPGSFPLLNGNYLMDNRGLRFKIIDTTAYPTLTVVDIFESGYSPYQGKIGYVYQSAGEGESPSLPTILFEKLDPKAFDYGYRIDMGIIWDEVSKKLENPVTFITFDSTVVIPTTKYTMYADTTDRTISVNLGNGVVMQINQETLIKVYNNTADTLKNGRILFGSGINEESITVDLAGKNERYSALLIATENIPPNSYGLAVELVGKVRGLNTLGLSKAPVYVDTLGLVTNTQPVFPNYIYPIGAVTKVDATEGIIQFRSDGVNFYNSIRAAFDGSIRESFDFRTFVEGGVIKGVLTNPTGANALTLVFSSGWYDFAVPDTINLTAGTSGLTGVLTDNYVYIPEDTRELTLSISAFPVDEFAKVAIINLSDVTNTILTGAYGNQNINNHFKSNDGNGHLVHAFDWIRWQPASWGRTGLATSLIAGTSSMQWTATGGIVRQFHKQTLSALDMTLGDYMLIKNDPDYPFRPVTDAGYLTKFSDGSNWSASWAPFVVWVVGNKTGEESHLVLNVPRGGYNTETAAMDDETGYADFTIPENFTSKGILLGKYAVRRVGSVYTHNPSTGYLDLRGTIPSSTPGGGGGSSGITDYTQLNQTPSVLEALAFQRVDVTGVTLENVLAENILLTEFDSTEFDLTQSQVGGLVDSLGVHRTDLNQNASDIDDIEAEQITQNTAIGLNTDKVSANNPTITIQGTAVTDSPKSFTLNQSPGETITIDAGIRGVASLDTLIVTAHGYAVGDVIDYSAKALGSNPDSANVIGIVYEVISVDTFSYQYAGVYTPGSWVVGMNYFLSTTVAGATADTTQLYEVGDVYLFLGTGVENGLLLEIDVGVLVDEIESSSIHYYDDYLIADENIIDVGFDLTSSSLVFLNGDLLLSDKHTYSGTELTLSPTILENDILIVYNNQTLTVDYFDKVLTLGENGINVGFTLSSSTLVFYNGDIILNALWRGEGTNTLTLALDTNLYDNVIVKN